MLNNKKLKIALIPIDNRPICYDLIKDILSINKNIELFLPEIEDLGGLTTGAKIDNLFKFLENLESIDYLVLSLDTLAYGGLVASRRCEDSFEVIKKRILKFKKIMSKKEAKILAFSSIMRISNNNINEEEKTYWQDWGEKIFDWSYNFHKKFDISNSSNIPPAILEDYLKTRIRNFEINKLYLKLAGENFFDTLVFSKDDCASFGLNIIEADILQELINKNNIKNTLIKTGADEIPLSLISRALSDYEKLKNKKIKINPIFLMQNSIDKISKYEDISINNCVLSQISLAGLELDEKNPDLNLIVNNFEKEQGDFVLGEVINSINEKSKAKLKEILKNTTPFLIADVNNANGADCGLVEFLFEKTLVDNFCGFCAYNTSANTIGCAILMSLTKMLALKEDSFNDYAFKKIMFIRFLDDWAFQSISRKFVREKGIKINDFEKILNEKKEELNQDAFKISKFLNYYPEKISYSLPWKRSFEIRIEAE